MFPPQAGMTFSTWVCVDKYSSPVADPHPVRLLTIVRSVANRDENLICLAVYLAPRDRALFVTTLETHMPQGAFCCALSGSDCIVGATRWRSA